MGDAVVSSVAWEPRDVTALSQSSVAMKCDSWPEDALGRTLDPNPHRADSLGEGADLVDLQQQGIAPLAVDALLHSHRVRNQQIVTHHLHRTHGSLLKISLNQ